MLDSDIHHLLAYTEARAEELGRDQGLEHVAEQLGYSIQLDEDSAVNHAARRIYLRRGQAPEALKSDLAHELAHALAKEGKPSWSAIIQRRHASVPDMHAHQEALTDLQGDLLTMPNTVVRVVLGICGLNAQAVWVLHQQQQVRLHEALRRLVHYDENARIGGFIAQKGRVAHAYSYRWHMPVWVGDKMPDPEDEFQGDGVSMFRVPGRPSTCVGMVVVE